MLVLVCLVASTQFNEMGKVVSSGTYNFVRCTSRCSKYELTTHAPLRRVDVPEDRGVLRDPSAHGHSSLASRCHFLVLGTS